jgi:hypothetical protein
MNARWKKSGYFVDRRTVHFLLKMHGEKEVELGLEDLGDGRFIRGLRVVRE